MVKTKIEFEKIPWQLVKNPTRWACGEPHIINLENLIDYYKIERGLKKW